MVRLKGGDPYVFGRCVCACVSSHWCEGFLSLLLSPLLRTAALSVAVVCVQLVVAWQACGCCLIGRQLFMTVKPRLDSAACMLVWRLEIFSSAPAS